MIIFRCRVSFALCQKLSTIIDVKWKTISTNDVKTLPRDTPACKIRNFNFIPEPTSSLLLLFYLFLSLFLNIPIFSMEKFLMNMWTIWLHQLLHILLTLIRNSSVLLLSEHNLKSVRFSFFFISIFALWICVNFDVFFMFLNSLSMP